MHFLSYLHVWFVKGDITKFIEALELNIYTRYLAYINNLKMPNHTEKISFD